MISFLFLLLFSCSIDWAKTPANMRQQYGGNFFLNYFFVSIPDMQICSFDLMMSHIALSAKHVVLFKSSLKLLHDVSFTFLALFSALILLKLHHQSKHQYIHWREYPQRIVTTETNILKKWQNFWVFKTCFCHPQLIQVQSNGSWI